MPSRGQHVAAKLRASSRRCERAAHAGARLNRPPWYDNYIYHRNHLAFRRQASSIPRGALRDFLQHAFSTDR